MTQLSIYAFIEGVTEERLLKQIGVSRSVTIINCHGKDKIPGKVEAILKAVLGTQPIGILILRDRDHNETHGSIVQSFEDVINELLLELKISNQSFKPHQKFKNLYEIDVPAANSRVALHIAAPPSISGMEFVSDTIDGYILALAMKETVLERFAEKADIAPEALRAKVIEEVPKLAKDNGINFDQAKDFLGVYMAMSRFFTNNRSEKDDVFSGVVVNRAKKRVTDEFQEIFRSIRTALEFLEIDL